MRFLEEKLSDAFGDETLDYLLGHKLGDLIHLQRDRDKKCIYLLSNDSEEYEQAEEQSDGN